MGKRPTEYFFVMGDGIITEKEYFEMKENETMEVFKTPYLCGKCGEEVPGTEYHDCKDMPKKPIYTGPVEPKNPCKICGEHLRPGHSCTNKPAEMRKCSFCGGFFTGWHYCGQKKNSISDLVWRPNPVTKEIPWDKIIMNDGMKNEKSSVDTVDTKEEKTATSVMVGGTHYKGGIQPIDFYHANPQLDFQECNMIKYAYRHKNKNGLQDLLKVVHYAMLEADLHYKADAEFKQMIKDLM